MNAVADSVAPERFLWRAAFVLGDDTMDAVHREFVDRVDALIVAPDEGVVLALRSLVDHTEAHFAQESRAMRDTAFPPVGCHESEHHNVLEVIREVAARAEQGDLAVARRLGPALAEWFALHAATMDAALAGWLKHRAQAGSTDVAAATGPAVGCAGAAAACSGAEAGAPATHHGGNGCCGGD